MEIQVKNLVKYFSDKLVIKNISFDLKSGELVGLFGPSGGGKSVLLKLLASVIMPSSGEINFLDPDSQGVENSSVGFLFQEGALFDSMSVIENVAFPLFSQKKISKEKTSREETYERAYLMLEEVGLAKAYQKLPAQLSGGMKRRAALARALVTNPKLVLLDDPTSGLDPVASSVIMDLIKKLHQIHQPTVVMVSHDLRRFLPKVQRVLGLFDGQLLCDLKPQQITSKAPKRIINFLETRFDFSQAVFSQ